MQIRTLLAGLAASTLAASASAALVGHWEFDDAGNLGLDSAGGDQNATATGGGSSAGVGVIGGALALDGSDTGLEITNSAAFQTLDTFTIMGFVNVDTTDPNWGGAGVVGRIFGSQRPGGAGGAGPNVGYGFGVIDDGRVRMTTYGIIDVNQGAAGDIPDGEWHHIAVTLSGGTSTFYIDGVQIATGGGGNPHDTTYNFHIGAGEVFAEANFVGLIDDLRVYDNALTGSEVAAIAAVPEPGSLALLGLGGLALLRRRRA